MSTVNSVLQLPSELRILGWRIRTGPAKEVQTSSLKFRRDLGSLCPAYRERLYGMRVGDENAWCNGSCV